MDTNAYYLVMIPLFALVMIVEATLLSKRREPGYTLSGTLANLGCGLGQNLFGIFTAGLILPLYAAFEARAALVHPPAWLQWVAAPFVVDFCYYWYHRASHQNALLWSIHAVHHQSEEMNAAVALRQTYFSDFAQLFFYWPAPLLGIDPAPFFFAVASLSIYQVTLHTRLRKSPGGIFNSPALHRLHHAEQMIYRDANFGATLIVWDRLFGTIRHETEAPMFGCGFASRNPLWAQAAPLLAFARHVRARGLRAFVESPREEWPTVTRPPTHERYVFWQSLLLLALAVPVLAFRTQLPFWFAALSAVLLIGSLGVLGLALDGHPAFLRWERVRVVVMLAWLVSPAVVLS